MTTDVITDVPAGWGMAFALLFLSLRPTPGLYCWLRATTRE
ncbi:MAG: hypothetical protein P8N50_00690 [Actinomycetota bacterium]|nr:hypothetical protein [Actinomycetota bacterium]